MTTAVCGRIHRYEFIGFHGCRSQCALEILRLRDGRTAVIATEVADNPGTSVTNAFELLATDVCAWFAIDPRRLVWIEHYGYPAAACPTEARGYDYVRFTIAPAPDGTCFSDVYWRPMRDADWRALGLLPRLAVRY